MTAPVRVQLSRAKGWRMPPDTVKVDRSTGWGNPFKRDVGGVKDNAEAVHLFRLMLAGYLPVARGPDIEAMRAQRRYVDAQLWRLRGKHLACWCRPGAPCHADVLLQLANSPPCDGEGVA